MARLFQPVSTLHSAEDFTRALIVQLEGLALQLQSAKQLRVCSHDDGRNAHRGATPPTHRLWCDPQLARAPDAE